MLNILTIDLEEWYHPEYVRKETLPHKEERIQHSLKTTIALLNKHDFRATFFVVGELAERYPEIVDILREGEHEIAFHGYHHEPLWELGADTLRQEIKKFNSLVGGRCAGFRAPSFSLNNRTRWALKVLENSEYRYDSSLFPVKTPLYGVGGAPMMPYKLSHRNISETDENGKLWEFPLLVYKLKGLRVPAAGGFYLRLLPVNLIARAIKKLNQQGFPAVIFFHNWELDPETPRLRLGLYKYFVTYHRLRDTSKRLEHLLSKFKFVCISEYIETCMA